MPRLPGLPSLLSDGAGYAYAYFNRRQIRFGRSDDPDHLKRFADFLSAWIANGRKLPDSDKPSSAFRKQPLRDPAELAGPDGPVSVVELIVRHVPWLETQYSESSRSHFKTICYALKMLRVSFGTMPADEFSSRHLTELREEMGRTGWSRKYINSQVGRIRNMFRWAIDMEHIEGSKYQKLLAMRNIRMGAPGHRETDKVMPAPEADVLAAIAHMPPVLADVLRLHLLTGARPKELLTMRWSEIRRDDSGDWRYRPTDHKNAHRGQPRSLCLTGEARSILTAYEDVPAGRTIFSPIRAEAIRNAARAERRATPRYSSHMKRNAAKRKPDRKRPPGETYPTAAYGRAIARACEKAGVAPFTPYQVRHLVGSKLLSITKNPEYVRALLGHASFNMTLHYSGRDERMVAEATRLLQPQTKPAVGENVD